jgi:hypothetical protein
MGLGHLELKDVIVVSQSAASMKREQSAQLIFAVS